MFCVIQEIQIKKPNRYGEYRELEVYQESWTVDNKPARWSYRRAGERFERLHMEAYKITLHQSYREGGRVKKRQYSITTMSYYDIVEYSLYDCADSRIKALSKLIGVDMPELYEIIEAKVEPLRERLRAEFHESEEYKTVKERDRALEANREARSAFCEQYEVDGSEYDRCYDVLGQLRNEEYLKKIVREHKRAKSSYQNYSHSNHYSTSGGSYHVSSPSTYTEGETAILKQFYRTLSKTFHPDLNPEQDTTVQMQFLNKLKEAWGI